MNEAGYTLTEMLVAMAMIGLTMGGLASGLAVLGRLQADDARAVADLNAARTAHGGVMNVLDGEGPFRSRDTAAFKGDAGGFQFSCGDAATCTVRLAQDGSGHPRLDVTDAKAVQRRFRLPGEGPLAFTYIGALGPNESWPPSGQARQILRAVNLRRAGPASHSEPDLFEARVWREQPADCAFDVLIQDCR
jgi:prepilin-type N-terminal cleavage/methylation domain-containing protein